MSPSAEVRLGDVLRLDRDRVPVEASKTYRMAGVYSFGRGLFARADLPGTGTTYQWLHRLGADQIVLSQLKAWEGAIARVTPEFVGAYLSPQFPTFTVDSNRVNAAFVDWYCRSPATWQRLRATARGIGARRDSVSASSFLSLTLRLPPLEEQARIATRLSSIDEHLRTIIGLMAEAARNTDRLVSAWSKPNNSDPAKTTVGDFAESLSGYAFEGTSFSHEGVRLLRNINVGHGTLRWHDVARFPTPWPRPLAKFELRSGDIVISLNRPVISTGVKIAMVSDVDLPALLVQRVLRLRFDPNYVLPAYFLAWATSTSFIRPLGMRPSSGVPYVPPGAILAIPFSPPEIDQQLRTIATLGRMQTVLEQVRRLRTLGLRDIGSLTGRTLDAAFRLQPSVAAASLDS